MPRPRLRRRIRGQPEATFFKPAGVRMRDIPATVLTHEEFEALRLKDYLGHDQSKAAKEMEISQPTFHRLLLSARKKLAEAVVKGYGIKIEDETSYDS